jgi:hypothetical protein
MPRKIENPLEDGISSKVYLLTYIYGPISGYRMARLIYGHPTYTNRIYEARDRINKGFPDAIGETEKGYIVSTKQLAKILTSAIDTAIAPSGDKLSKNEKDKILDILDSASFRSFVREGAQAFIGAEEMKNINSIQFVLDALFDISMMHMNAELSLKGKRTDPRLKKARVVNGDEMGKLVDLITTVPTSLALKIISIKPLFLEYVLNISDILKSGG